VNIANLITSLRLYLSPIFFVVAFIPHWTSGRFALASTVVLWVLFAITELSDMVDGMVARRQKIVSDLGKLMDPFADVITHLTYFVVFVSFSIMPAWMFVLILYREVGIMFVRMLMMKDGVALAARKGGKVKTVMYVVSSGLGLLVLTHARLGNLSGLMPALRWITVGAFGVSVALCWGSMIDYLIILRRHYRDRR